MSDAAIEEGQSVARAYQAAAEADTMAVMNVQSTNEGLDDLTYYIVPESWYRKAWCSLLKPGVNIPVDWREQVGALEAVQPWWDKSCGLDTSNMDWVGRPPSTKPTTAVHGDNYYFVGKNAWGVLENKFSKSGDSAHGVACRVVSWPLQDSRLAVQLPNGERIPIPGSGRFAYETSLEKADGAVRMDDESNAANTVEDEDDQINVAGNTQEGPILMSSAPPSPKRDPPAQELTPSLREYGSGLANLGNTCFMSATIQCLGHTHHVLKYFLSGSFMNDLNRDNPLGTGGDLAIEFAKLLREIWIQNNAISNSHLGYVSNHVVYPRSFKMTVGKHAEQFSGYDQHDTQEFVTYLLDALHEDTNRVSKKPYIEKPEQGEDESDQEAADKAWELHLQRENSRVLEQFMGQVKSRVQCCEEGCGRVSTTFDPFMYLSVPIPGSSDRQIKVTFVPLDADKRPMKLTLVISKDAVMGDLLQKCRERMIALGTDSAELLVEDLVAVDVWNNEIYSWYENKVEVEQIKENDDTLIYQLRPLGEVRELSKNLPSSPKSEDALELSDLPSSGRKHQLDVATLSRLNHGDAWGKEIAEYLRNHMAYLHTFNPSKGTTEGRLRFLNSLNAFLEKCHEILEKKDENETQSEDTTAQRRHSFLKGPSEDPIQEIIDLTETSTMFENVSSKYDVAILEFCASKLREETLNIIQQKKRKDLPDGALVQVRSKCYSTYASSRDTSLAGPLVLRIPSNMTVYQLREELAYRMRRSIRTGREASTGETTSEIDAQRTNGLISPSAPRSEHNGFDKVFGSPELMKLRQVPMCYERSNKKASYGASRYSTVSSQLGSLAKPGSPTPEKRSSPLVNPSEQEEKEEVARLVGDKGTILLEWPGDLADECFDTVEYNSIEEPLDDEDVVNSHKPKQPTTVLDCIDKYCQMEQLEETEMWYCNKCKKHVRAWKQFHLYRAPPILIIHLKRFHYSASTHRRNKIEEFIDFPLEGFDLSKHFMNWKEGEKPIYDCYGISNHYGGLGGGHYTAHALHDNGVWCYYDDTRITSNVDPKEAVTKAAYVLYYRRRDVPTDMEFSISTETPEERRPPAVILENSDRMNGHFERSDSNAALIGDEDNMDIDNTDAASRSTSPMSEGHDEDIIKSTFLGDDSSPDDQDQLPRQ